MNRHEPHIFEGEVIINNVALPRQVVDELRRLGIALSWYNAGELRDAVEACAADGKLIDDPHGIHFRDQLKVCMHEELPEHVGDIFTHSKRKKSWRKWMTPQAQKECNSHSGMPVKDQCGLSSWFS